MMDGTEYTETSWPSSRMLQSELAAPPSVSQLDTASGIAVSGALIFNALAAGNSDAVENEWVTLD